MNLKPFREIEKDAKPVSMPGEIKKIDKVGIVVQIGDKWFAEKNLKNFENPTFKTTEKFPDPVYVYEYEILVGLVMPVKVKDGDSDD